MIVRLLACAVLLSSAMETAPATAQERRVPVSRPSAASDLSDYVHPTFMRMLMTGGFETLDRIGPSNAERSRIRGYLVGLFDVMAPFASSSRGGTRSRAADSCRDVSAVFADHHEYLKGWLRDYVKLYQTQLLQSIARRDALGRAGVLAAPGAFADMGDVVQDGKTDGARLVRVLEGCDAPVFKTIVDNVGHIRRNLPSSADPYVPRALAASDLQSLTGYYAIRGPAAITGVTVAAVEDHLTMTDSRGRTYDLRPAGDHVFVIDGAGQDRVTFHPQRQGIVFGLGSTQFMGTRAQAPVGFDSAAARYETLTGQYTVITSPSLKRERTVAAIRDSVLTVAMVDGILTLTDANGRQHRLQSTGTDAFVIPGTQVAIRFVVGPRVITLQYREGVQGFSARRPQAGPR